MKTSFDLTLVLFTFHLTAALRDITKPLTIESTLALTWVLIASHLTAALLNISITLPIETSFDLTRGLTLFFDLSLILTCQCISYICLHFFQESPNLKSILLFYHISNIRLSLFVKKVLILYLSCFVLTCILNWGRQPESKYFDLSYSAKPENPLHYGRDLGFRWVPQ